MAKPTPTARPPKRSPPRRQGNPSRACWRATSAPVPRPLAQPFRRSADGCLPCCRWPLPPKRELRAARGSTKRPPAQLLFKVRPVVQARHRAHAPGCLALPAQGIVGLLLLLHWAKACCNRVSCGATRSPPAISTAVWPAHPRAHASPVAKPQIHGAHRQFPVCAQLAPTTGHGQGLLVRRTQDHGLTGLNKSASTARPRAFWSAQQARCRVVGMLIAARWRL